jgi:hypothetical protein
MGSSELMVEFWSVEAEGLPRRYFLTALGMGGLEAKAVIRLTNGFFFHFVGGLR